MKIDLETCRKNRKTHTLLTPKECGCDKISFCNICDGGLAYCVVCYGGELELEQYSCKEYKQLKNND